MEGNPELEPARGDPETKAPADINPPSGPQGTQSQIEVTEAQIEDTTKENVKSWIEAQSETQPQPPTGPPTVEVDDAVGELPRVENTPRPVPGVTDTTVKASTTTSAPGTNTPEHVQESAAEASFGGVGAVSGSGSGPGPALITPRRRAASTSTGPSTTAAGHGHGLVPQFVAPSSYLRRRTSLRSPMAPTEPKPLSPLDRDQLQGLVCLSAFCLSHPFART